MRVYISGPMTGILGHNYQEFNRAEDELRRRGHTPLNPARNPPYLEYHHYMDIALAMVRSAEAVYRLIGWADSPGALAEVAYAGALDLEMIDQPPAPSPPGPKE